jgi:hypothetical protein
MITTTLVAMGCGIIGAWIVSRFIASGDKSSRRVAQGYFVSQGYLAKSQRQCRSEFAANLAMRQGMIR